MTALGIALVIAALSLLVAGYHFWPVYYEMRGRLPPHLRDEALAGAVVRGLVWEPSFPGTVRRRYFISMIATCCLTVALSAAALIHSGILVALPFIGASAVVIFQTIRCWRRHRHQL